MKYLKTLKGAEKEISIKWMDEAAKAAGKSLCLRDKCGAVIVKDEKIIGEGYSGPPLDDLENRACLNEYKSSDKKPKSDRTCCVHAEWRAILDAFRKNPEKIEGSQIFFTRVDEKGVIKKSGEPYCTVCSRLALDVGISKFVLWHEKGIASYPTDEYNRLSYNYHK